MDGICKRPDTTNIFYQFSHENLVPISHLFFAQQGSYLADLQKVLGSIEITNKIKRDMDGICMRPHTTNMLYAFQHENLVPISHSSFAQQSSYLADLQRVLASIEITNKIKRDMDGICNRPDTTHIFYQFSHEDLVPISHLFFAQQGSYLAALQRVRASIEISNKITRDMDGICKRPDTTKIVLVVFA